MRHEVTQSNCFSNKVTTRNRRSQLQSYFGPEGRSPLFTGCITFEERFSIHSDQLGCKQNAQTFQINAPNHVSQNVGIRPDCQSVDSNYRVFPFQRGAAHLYVVTKCLKYHYEDNAPKWCKKETR